MEDVTDYVFREIISQEAPPDVFFTEFTNVAGLMSEGREIVERRLRFSKNQKPIVAQIWGTNPQNFFEAAEYIRKLGFDGIDINMGCPQKKVIKMGAGAGLIKTPKLAKEIIAATKEGAREIPVSVKTRLGFNKIKTEEWAGLLLKQNIDALIMHGRTRKQMSKAPANWEEIGKLVKIRNESSSKTVIIGNGDVESREEAEQKAKRYEVDGIMIGRGVLCNPWIFEEKEKKHSKEDYLKLLLKHAELFEDTWKEKKNFSIMKKFFKMYVREFEEASDLRQKLMQAENYKEVENIIKETLR
jgi:nifR3 family TIM-barrel protein